MSDGTGIEWTDATWNPVRGCTRVSEGCRHCYAETLAARFSGPGQPYEGLAGRVTHPDGTSEARWTGRVRSVKELMGEPTRWKKPRRIFVNSMSDLFHEAVDEAIIDSVFAVMGLAPQHTFQILTKRPERMVRYFKSRPADHGPWRLANVWLGVSVEDQATADARIPPLLQTPAAKRFISAEPLLGPVDLDRIAAPQHTPEDSGWAFDCLATGDTYRLFEEDGRYSNSGDGPYRDHRLDWVIVGGESGPGARPMHPDWARSLRDQCAAAGVPFFFKQWGAWAHEDQHLPNGRLVLDDFTGGGSDGQGGLHWWPDGSWSVHLRKSQTGALLDGREHKEFPT
ncbi:DUF5131 family protein [Elioraea sp.]|uniref:DUF5131 family protein n=1 Tax=Elioraea sp. TaxID=2185103 RepID=UPI0025B7E601|nr:phage Gp37/Gp68 family protein [Elioraea sp.]